MNERKVWFLKISDGNGRSGIGEVAPIERLSPDIIENIPEELEKIKLKLQQVEPPSTDAEIWKEVKSVVSREFPSIRFGLEIAMLDLMNGGLKEIFVKDLSSVKIQINGLVWMGDKDFMEDQIKEKLDQGFNCIKLKIGSLDFDTELDIIKQLRKVSDDLIIRLDANGAFQTNEVLMKLKQLSKFNIHSIEQPILPMQPEAMEIVCKKK